MFISYKRLLQNLLILERSLRLIMHSFFILHFVVFVTLCSAFPCTNHNHHQVHNLSTLLSHTSSSHDLVKDRSRRAIGALICIFPSAAYASINFTPGGTLVERELGVRVGNNQSATSRNVDNSNVLFKEDTYFKFGTGAPFIEPGSTEFPKNIPFVLTQQRYDGLKKYKSRVEAGIVQILSLEKKIQSDEFVSIPSADDPIYGLRPFGLLANSFLASENTGTTNELLLTRYYINEIYLRINELRRASSKSEAIDEFDAIKMAINSYLSIMNRAISSKVGEKFKYI